MLFVVLIIFTTVNISKQDCDFKKYELKSPLPISPEFTDKINSCSESVQSLRELGKFNSTGKFYGARHWADLLFSRTGRININWDDEQEVNNILNLTICDKHLEALITNFTENNSLYIKVSRRGKLRHHVKLCSFPNNLSTTVGSHSERRPPFQRYLWKEHSAEIVARKGYFLPPGLPICNQHYEWAQNLINDEQFDNQDENMNNLEDAINEDSSDEDFDIGDSSFNSSSKVTKEIRRAFQKFTNELKLHRLNTQRSYSDLKSDTKRKKITDGIQIFHVISKIIAPEAEDEFRYQVCQKATLKDNDILPPRVRERMYELAENYLKEQNKDMRKRFLSFMTVVLSFAEIHQYLPNIDRRKYKEASQLTKETFDLYYETPARRVRYSEEKVRSWALYLTSPSIVTKLPWGMKSSKLSTGEKVHFPNVVRQQQGAQLIRMYIQELKDRNRTDLLLPNSTLWYLMSKATATTAKNLRGVDSFIAIGRDAFDALKAQVQLWQETGYIHEHQAKIMKHHLLESQQYLETTYKSLLREDSQSASHCIFHALSDPKKDHFRITTQHNHTFVHASDIKLNNILIAIDNKGNDIVKQIEERKGRNSLDAEEAKRYVQMIKLNIEDIQKMRQHILRAVYSDRTRQVLTNNLQEGEALITADWAQKYEGLYHRERQDQYYGRRGVSWHITHVVTKILGQTAQHTYVHVIEKARQDTSTVVAILIDVFKNLKLWHINTVTLRSDNAGCYHSNEMIGSIPEIMKQSGVKIKEVVFSETQAGKSSCDREAARIKHKFREVSRIKDVVTAEEMILAMSFQGNLPFITMKIIELSDAEKHKTSRLKFRKRRSKSTKEKHDPFHIRDYGYWRIHEKKFTVFRFYGIGNGRCENYTSDFLKLYKKKDIEINETIFDPLEYNQDVNEESELDYIQQKNESRFWRITMTNRQLRELDENDEIDEDSQDEREPQTMADCFLYMYKGCLEDIITGHNEMSAASILISEFQQDIIETSQVDSFPEGWAIPSKTKYSLPPTKEIKEFLRDLFQQGEQTASKKVAPERARKALEEARYSNGSYMFEFRTIPSIVAITSFFSNEKKRMKGLSSQHLPINSTITPSSSESLVSHIYEDECENNAHLQIEADNEIQDIFSSLMTDDDYVEIDYGNNTNFKHKH